MNEWSLEVTFESSCKSNSISLSGMRHSRGPWSFAVGSAGRQLSQCARIQCPAEEPLRRAARGRRSRRKAVRDELRRLPWGDWTRKRQRPSDLRRTYAIGTGRRGFLVRHNRIRRQRHAGLGQPVRAESILFLYFLFFI